MDTATKPIDSKNATARVADKIKELRREARLNQTEFGRKLGASQKTVSQWEHGTVPTLEFLVQISVVFDITLDNLIKN